MGKKKTGEKETMKHSFHSFFRQMQFQIEVKAINLIGENVWKDLFRLIAYGNSHDCLETGIYSLRSCLNNGNSLSNPVYPVTPCYAEFRTFEFYFLVPISFIICSSLLVFCSILQSVLNAFQLRSANHSNYAALIHSTKVETFHQPFQFSAHISNIETIFRTNVHTFWQLDVCTALLHRMFAFAFPFAHSNFARISFWYSKFNPYPRLLLDCRSLQPKISNQIDNTYTELNFAYLLTYFTWFKASH